jgi:hypothetical protein
VIGRATHVAGLGIYTRQAGCRFLFLAQSPLGLRLRDQIRMKVSASSSSNRLA